MYNINQNQTAETTHLSNNTHTTINLSVPKKDNPTMLPNINNSPQNVQNYNPVNNQTFNPNIEIKPSIQIQMPPQEPPKRDTFIGLDIKFTSNPERMSCPHCSANITTRTEKSTNMKALLVAIGTCYFGYALMQICNDKDTSISDCKHFYPNCGKLIGVYYAL